MKINKDIKDEFTQQLEREILRLQNDLETSENKELVEGKIEGLKYSLFVYRVLPIPVGSRQPISIEID